jgi:hypothetical protein
LARRIRSVHVSEIASIKRIIIAAAKNTTNQKRQRLLLPLPLRKNGVVNATDTELERAQKFCEHFSIGSTGLVFIGLVLEVYIAFEHPPFDSYLEIWGSVIADILVAFGVLGELLPSMLVRRYNTEVKRRSDASLSEATRQAGEAHERASEAEKKSAEANLEVTRLQTQLAPRHITLAQSSAISAKMSELAILPGTNAQRSVAVFPTSPAYESAALGDQIAFALQAAGWNVNRFPVDFGRPLSFRGVGLLISSSPRGVSVAMDLSTALNEQGIFTFLLPTKQPGGEALGWSPEKIESDPAFSHISIMVGDHP